MPCIRVINWLVREDIIQKHDGISVIAVFIVYFVLIGTTLGVAVGLLIRSIKNRLTGGQADKELQTNLAEIPQDKVDGDNPAKRSKWPRLLLSHILVSYLTMLVLGLVFLYTGHPDESGPTIQQLILAPIFVPYLMVLLFVDYMSSVATGGFSIGGPSATFIASWA
jgi:hypothetical protein